jgi:hypothetical protein
MASQGGELLVFKSELVELMRDTLEGGRGLALSPQMKGDGLFNVSLNLFFRGARGDAPGKIGTKCGVVFTGFLVNDQVFAHFNLACVA